WPRSPPCERWAGPWPPPHQVRQTRPHRPHGAPRPRPPAPSRAARPGRAELLAHRRERRTETGTDEEQREPPERAEPTLADTTRSAGAAYSRARTFRLPASLDAAAPAVADERLTSRNHIVTHATHGRGRSGPGRPDSSGDPADAARPADERGQDRGCVPGESTSHQPQPARTARGGPGERRADRTRAGLQADAGNTRRAGGLPRRAARAEPLGAPLHGARDRGPSSETRRTSSPTNPRAPTREEKGDRMSPKPTGHVRGNDLILTRTFRAPIDDVWTSVTDSESTARWIGRWEGDAGPGKTVRLQMLH